MLGLISIACVHSLYRPVAVRRGDCQRHCQITPENNTDRGIGALPTCPQMSMGKFYFWKHHCLRFAFQLVTSCTIFGLPFRWNASTRCFLPGIGGNFPVPNLTHTALRPAFPYEERTLPQRHRLFFASTFPGVLQCLQPTALPPSFPKIGWPLPH